MQLSHIDMAQTNYYQDQETSDNQKDQMKRISADLNKLVIDLKYVIDALETPQLPFKVNQLNQNSQKAQFQELMKEFDLKQMTDMLQKKANVGKGYISGVLFVKNSDYKLISFYFKTTTAKILVVDYLERRTKTPIDLIIKMKNWNEYYIKQQIQNYYRLIICSGKANKLDLRNIPDRRQVQNKKKGRYEQILNIINGILRYYKEYEIKTVLYIWPLVKDLHKHMNRKKVKEMMQDIKMKYGWVYGDCTEIIKNCYQYVRQLCDSIAKNSEQKIPIRIDKQKNMIQLCQISLQKILKQQGISLNIISKIKKNSNKKEQQGSSRSGSINSSQQFKLKQKDKLQIQNKLQQMLKHMLKQQDIKEWLWINISCILQKPINFISIFVGQTKFLKIVELFQSRNNIQLIN